MRPWAPARLCLAAPLPGLPWVGVSQDLTPRSPCPRLVPDTHTPWLLLGPKRSFLTPLHPLQRGKLRHLQQGNLPANWFPLTTESAMKKIEDKNILVFIEDVKANKHQIKKGVFLRCFFFKVIPVRALPKMFELGPTLPKAGPGEKKVYVCLAPDYDALDVADKIGII
uniref:Uncharacterized protein n=1 Tax=Chrysemys picta bellii TaxID=8478 RepID=A0A8C3IFV1_CHRPI